MDRTKALLEAADALAGTERPPCPLGARVVGEAGPVVVLIHGLGRVALAWALVADALRGRVRLVLPDNPGFGRSSHLRVPLSIAAHARAHRDTLEALGLPPPFHVAGLSLGGMIAPVLAAELGPLCASLAIFSSSSLETGFWRLSPLSLGRMGARVVVTLGLSHHVNMPELVRREVLEASPGLADALDRIQAREGFRVRNGIRQILAASAFRIRPFEGRLPARRLVAVGSRDRLVGPYHSRRLATRLGAPLVEIPGAGHDLGVDAPESMASILVGVAEGASPSEIRTAVSGNDAGLLARGAPRPSAEGGT